ncbi:MAG: UDP-N-acetylglucosamine 1-carboxyvinyltransferase [Phycisphaeraceae bacterium]|nr:UDP-N-acetylglucosamine 1-carboxyvinyltransferase [Phycisphaeraceae bacterium]MCW5763761.1 UDP-N-acetylglucosamine 1-carboxyvinyltransferase [Phycisphaeraceae bacterium]
MDAFTIEGGRRLEGTTRINGSKNAALPLMAAALLTPEPVILRDVPDLADITNMKKLLDTLGCEVIESEKNAEPSLTLCARDQSQSHAHYDIVRTMRAGICVLGPMLASRGVARVSLPGGCAIGERPIDLHLRGLAALGAQISLDGGDVVATVPTQGLRGTTIFLGGPFGSTVLGTANVMSAAALAKGTSIIESAACEPEIVDLANLLNAMGARITGAGTPRITIEGVKSLHGAIHTVIPDRIEAGTMMCAAAITNGSLTITNTPLDAMLAVTDRLVDLGVHIDILDNKDPMRATCRISSERILRPIRVTTQPHPGFPTDLQAQVMALLSIAEGNSIVTERIFPERFLHVAELGRMGAQLHRQGATVVVTGVRELHGAPVMASDLRASASLVIAALAARGTTIINRVYHIDRGYERLEHRLASLGAAITRTEGSA